MEKQLKSITASENNQGGLIIPKGVYGLGLAIIGVYLYKIRMDTSDKYFVG